MNPLNPTSPTGRMDGQAVLALFDAQMRRDAPAEAGARVDRIGPVVRQVADAADGWTGVLWSDLDAGGPRDADAAIAAQTAWLAGPAGAGREFEWKLYAHDRPADLGERLLAAGFTPEPAEALMVAETADVLASTAGAELPDGVRLLPVTDAAGAALAARAHERAFGADAGRLHAMLLDQLARNTASLEIVVAMAGDEPVCGARLQYCPGADFAGLWGGGTVPRWRGRGIYRALVAHRARRAHARGVRFLQVDASDDSRPILERLGFTVLSTTTPYVKQG